MYNVFRSVLSSEYTAMFFSTFWVNFGAFPRALFINATHKWLNPRSNRIVVSVVPSVTVTTPASSGNRDNVGKSTIHVAFLRSFYAH